MSDDFEARFEREKARLGIRLFSVIIGAEAKMPVPEANQRLDGAEQIFELGENSRDATEVY